MYMYIPTASKLQCWMAHANQLQDRNTTHPLAERLPKIIRSSQTPQKHHWTWSCPPERQDPAPPTRTEVSVPSNRKPIQPTEPTSPPGGRHQNNRNYKPAACKKETPNTVSLTK